MNDFQIIFDILSESEVCPGNIEIVSNFRIESYPASGEPEQSLTALEKHTVTFHFDGCPKRT